MITDFSHQQYPLIAQGAHVYGRMQSSPLFTANSPEAAAELARQLNEFAKIQTAIAEQTGGIDAAHLVQLKRDLGLKA